MPMQSPMEEKFQQFEKEIAGRQGASERMDETEQRSDAAPAISPWVRLTAAGALLVVGLALYRLPGGFPAPAWVELARLARARALLPLQAHIVTLAQALALAIAWILWLVVALRVARWGSPGARLKLARSGEGAATGAEHPSARASPGAAITLPLSREEVAAADSQPQVALCTLMTDSSTAAFSRAALPVASAGPGDTRAFGTRAALPGIGLALGCFSQPGRVLGGRAAEDSLLVVSGLRLWADDTPRFLPVGAFVVADGEIARADQQTYSTSRLAVDAVSQALLPLLAAPGPWEQDQDALERRVLDGIGQANALLCGRAAGAQAAAGAGETTLAAVLVLGASAYVASVGNCRAYLYHAGEGLLQLTAEHEAGEGAGTDETGSASGQLYRSLGRGPRAHVDLSAIQLSVGDILLLCTDGLWGTLERALLEQTLQWFAGATRADPFRLCSLLRETAMEKGAPDHFSAIVAQVIPLDQTREGPMGEAGSSASRHDAVSAGAAG